MKVVPVPCLKDNYAWLIIPADGPLWAVDPGEAAPVLNAARGLGRPLGGVLLTHHHADHVGGVDGIRAAFPNLVVIGAREDAARLPRLDMALNPGRFEFGGMVGEMRAVPAHTKGHVAFIVDEFLFCGDTLFSGGCGRLFEGTPDELDQLLAVTKKIEGRTICAFADGAMWPVQGTLKHFRGLFEERIRNHNGNHRA